VSAGLDLAGYRWIVASISGGKDSQTMLRRLVAMADDQGVPRDRIVCVFADLGERDEWPAPRALGKHLVKLYGDRPGAAELARLHAEHYGLRFEVVTRLKDGRPQDLLDHIQDRRMWPSREARYCTSDMKRGPILTIFTRLAAEARQEGHSGPVRMLNAMGMRAAESPARARLAPLRPNGRATGEGTVKVVDDWLPIHAMTEAEVWADIKASGVPWHWVYDAGLPRLSCRFCVLAGKHALARAAQLDPDGAWLRAEVEDAMAYRWAKGFSMLDVLELAEQAGELTAEAEAVPCWAG
jgi:3'-phosphoadenosine 5'-phosphosulfate sulfotransferase (PAPS reductase)/FAD synthetase